MKNIRKLKKKTTKLYNSTEHIPIPGIKILYNYQARSYTQKLFSETETEKTVSDKKLFPGTESLPNAYLTYIGFALLLIYFLLSTKIACAVRNSISVLGLFLSLLDDPATKCVIC